MLSRVCAVAQRSSSFSTRRVSAKKTSAVSRRGRKLFCSTASGSETLAESAAKNGGVAKFPSGFASVDEPSEKVLNLADTLMNISFFEAAQLTKVMQKRLGTTGMGMPMMAASAMPAAGAAAAAPAAAAEPAKPAEAAKPSRVDVKLVSFPDANKFKVLKEIRNLKPGMNLMESKALIEGLPKVVMESLLYKDAEDWKKALTEAGADVELV